VPRIEEVESLLIVTGGSAPHAFVDRLLLHASHGL
jgi:hypothetical protein